MNSSEPRPVAVEGKFFRCGSERFHVRGVTYGTFAPRPDDHERYPDARRVAADFAAISAAGFNVVRTYTEPPNGVVEAARDHELKLLAGVFYDDWRYLIGGSRRDRSRIARDARTAVRTTARRLAGSTDVFALSLGNEIPADVIRWVGVAGISRVISELVEVCREEDPQRLVTYANYPTAEYLSLDGVDFITFNVYLERKADLRRYLNRLHHVAGDRPVVLGEIGQHAAHDDLAELEQAVMLDWQLETAVERGMAGTCVFSWTDEWHVGESEVTDWNFGLTRRDRTAKPALEVAKKWNHRTVSDLDAEWPTISVVICAYNAEPTLEECLRHCVELDYPELEIIVIDDGSTDATPSIAASFDRVRLITIEHAGLGAARNAGIGAASNDLVAYLDSDAYPTPEWPYYLALGLDARDVGGVGGPNVSPVGDPAGAQAVACAPGGPVHVLLSDDRAEHVPGCNMAFWRTVLEDAGGFDPAYTSAGDDVDICWKVIDSGWRIAFHPAALIWHHRRSGALTYVRQQRGYGRAESLVAARHPHRFTRLGTARWTGFIYQTGTRQSGSLRTYRGPFGSAAFQSVYRTPSHAIDIVHQVGVPGALAAIATAPIVALDARLGLVAAAGIVLLAALLLVDFFRVRPPVTTRQAGIGFRLRVAALHILQPFARKWGRSQRTLSPQSRRQQAKLPGPSVSRRGGIVLVPADRPRERLSELAMNAISASGVSTTAGSAWSSIDATVHGSFLVEGNLVTSAFPVGAVQMRVRLVWRPVSSMIATATVLVSWMLIGAPGALIATGLACADILRGMWRAGPRARQAIRDSADHVTEWREVHEAASVDRWLAPVTFEPAVDGSDALFDNGASTRDRRAVA